MSKAQIASIAVIVFVIILIFIAYFKIQKKSTIKFINMVLTAVCSLSSLIVVIFPEKVSAIIYPESSTFKDENIKLIDENDALKKENAKLKKENDGYEKKDMAVLSKATVIIDGLKKSEIEKGLAKINNQYYFHNGIIESITGKSVSVDGENILYGNDSKNGAIKVKFSEISDILYNGKVYRKVTPADKKMRVAGKEYDSGLTIGCDYSILGDGDGYALFNLESQYQKMEFDVGKTDENEIQDVTLAIYVDKNDPITYNLSAENPSEHISINLNNAKTLKIQITEGTRVVYGFFNIVLTKG